MEERQRGVLIMILKRGEDDSLVEMAAYREERSEREINRKELRGERKADGKRERNRQIRGSRK